MNIGHMKQTIRKIDAFLENYVFGTLVVENEHVFLVTENDEIQLDDSFIIEVFDGSQYHRISYEQALNTYCSDMPDCPLFAGLETKVKRKEVA